MAYSTNDNIGIHPFYDGVYHQIINGYSHFSILDGNTSFSANTTNGTINERFRDESNNLRYWTGFVDNSKFDSTDLRYTLLPSDGSNKNINRKTTTSQIPILGNTTQIKLLFANETFDTATQNNFRIIWAYDNDDYINDEFSGRTFPSYSEYNKSLNTTNRSLDNQYSLTTKIGRAHV